MSYILKSIREKKEILTIIPIQSITTMLLICLWVPISPDLSAMNMNPYPNEIIFYDTQRNSI